ncbi:2-dehydropantoate 2-reductase [Niveispirillum lacus]|uniref:2-dehydropantoate 2-reductase n=1 Tax=Niveispirillum lacus TaxID=1981099 RepID=A0A255YY67_9PROT|nr:2-dehydropantoate 2-reductase [Niveispirillum lacus]OYQ34111.1 2-dehydropantoate 2-reductase [Niveispirillum lacus]
MSLPRIAIIGAGAIGTVIAARLAATGRLDVSLCRRSGGFETLHVQGPDGSISATPVLLTDPARAAPVNWVITTTKAYDSAAAAATWLPHLMRGDTRLAVLQNGVEHGAAFAGLVDPALLLPVMLDIPAERLGPGRVLQRASGLMVVPDQPGSADFIALFAGTGIAVTADTDFTTVIWRKLCLNAAGAVSALLRQPAGIIHHAGAEPVMRALVAECVAVAQAEGAKLDGDTVEQVMAACRGAAVDGINSLLADRLAGRPLELDARNGVIVRRGEVHGIPTPVNRTVRDLIQAAVAAEQAQR